MKQPPVVSIVIPVYNAQNFIVRCFQSIQDQTFLDYEVIIVNDGSKDDSKRIIENFISDKQNWFFFSKENEGVAITRNFGINQTRGEYLVFIDIDDFVEKDYLRKLHNGIRKKNVNLVCCGYNDLSINGIIPLNNYDDRSSNVISANEFSKLLFSHIGGVLWDKMFDATIIRDSNLTMNLDVYFYEDSLFILDYLKFVDTVNILDDPLYNYNRTNETSFTKKINYTWKDNIIAFNKEIIKKFKFLNFTNAEKNLIIQKNISSFVFTIFQQEKLKLHSHNQKLSIINSLIHDSFLKENFKPKGTNFIYKPYIVFFKYKMPVAVIFYSKILSYLKKILNYTKTN